MDMEDIIQLLISKTGKTRNEILNLIEKKQLDAGGTISDRAAASLVSKDLGLKLSEISIPQPTKINDLLHMAPGSSNITIIGTVKRLYSPHQFSTEDNNKVVQNLILIDSSTSIRVVIWVSMVKLIESLKILKGNQIRIIKGLLKNGRLGERELHVNDSSSIEKLDYSENEESIDVWSDVLLPSSITKEHVNIREVDIQGIVTSTYISEETERPSIITLINPDGADFNSLKVNFWKERKNEVNSLEIGQHVLLEGANVKEGLQNTLEANFNRNSNLSILGKIKEINKIQKYTNNQILHPSQNTSIDKDLNLIQMGENFNLIVKIAWIGKLGNFERKDGSKGFFIRVGIYDNTGSNIIVFWDENAKTVQNFSTNDMVQIQNAYLKENKGNIEITLGRYGKIKKITDNEKKISNKLPSVPIDNLSKNWKILSLWGGVLNINDERTFKRNDGTEGKVKSIDIVDNTGQLRVVAWNDKIENLKKITTGLIIFINEVTLRMNNYNEFEAHLNDHSEIQIIQNELEFPDWVKNLEFTSRKRNFKKMINYQRISIGLLTDEYKEKFLNESDNGSDYSNTQNSIELRANIVDIFENPLFYASCPQCMKKVEIQADESGNCSNHGIVSPVPRLLFRVILDDGVNTMTTTLIGTSAEKITGFSPMKLKDFLIENNNDKEILRAELKNLLFGKEFLIRCKLEVRKNFNDENFNWDLKINYISEANPFDELRILELEQ